MQQTHGELEKLVSDMFLLQSLDYLAASISYHHPRQHNSQGDNTTGRQFHSASGALRPSLDSSRRKPPQ